MSSSSGTSSATRWQRQALAAAKAGDGADAKVELALAAEQKQLQEAQMQVMRLEQAAQQPTAARDEAALIEVDRRAAAAMMDAERLREELREERSKNKELKMASLQAENGKSAACTIS